MSNMIPKPIITSAKNKESFQSYSLAEISSVHKHHSYQHIRRNIVKFKSRIYKNQYLKKNIRDLRRIKQRPKTPHNTTQYIINIKKKIPILPSFPTTDLSSMIGIILYIK